MKKIIITTGGTGGHIFPAESIAKGLVKEKYNVIFITDKRGASFRKLNTIQTKVIYAESVTGKSFFKMLKSLLILGIGFIQSIWILLREKPSLVIGVGGYASLPAVLAAQKLRIPTIVHEQNSVLGRANRLLAPHVKFIATAYEDTKRVPAKIETFLVGQPVRDIILEKYKSPYVKNDIFKLLITGGSQGARFLSRELPKGLIILPKRIKEKLAITQQARPEDINYLQELYQDAGFYSTNVQSFFDNIPELLEKTNLVISRSGSSTLAELAIVGRPGIFIPLPSSADNHQFENARQFSEAGAGWLIAEKDFDPELFSERLTKLIESDTELKDAVKLSLSLAHPDVAEKMVELVQKVIG